jgi:NAD+ synthase (glutamine-hydrolysing)
MVANHLQQILLVTSNRSEAAVGYATMDGDTCGGLAPVAGVDKAFIMSWLQWLADGGLPSDLPDDCQSTIQRIIDRKPSAELRPTHHEQSDEEDLMPYPVLDVIEEAYVLHGKSPRQIIDTLQRQKDWPDQQIEQWVQKFCRLWSQNQWKRERYAPAFHLDDRNVDPRSFCRYPILSGHPEF